MGSHVLDVLRQGIWASLSGGWFYDPHLSIFSNTFHLYLWMFLLAFPLILHLTLPASFLTWALYCVVVGLVFVLIKFFNFKLHHMFDTSEMIEEGADDKDSKKGDNSSGIGVAIGSQEPEEFEMTTFKADSASVENRPCGDTKSLDPFETQAQAKSGSSGRKRKSRRSDKSADDPSTSRAPLAEMDKMDIDVLQYVKGGSRLGGGGRHHQHSNTDVDEDDDTPTDVDEDLSIPNTITTHADVEAEPSDCHVSLPDDSLNLEALSTHFTLVPKHAFDASIIDMPPEHSKDAPRKPRRRPQRARSALESSSLPSKHSSERSLRSRPSLPARTKLQSVINKDTGVSIVRPWSDETISRTKQMLESDEITVIDFKVMNNVAKAYQTRSGAGKLGKSKLTESIEETSEKEVIVHSGSGSDGEVPKEFKVDQDVDVSANANVDDNSELLAIATVDKSSDKSDESSLLSDSLECGQIVSKHSEEVTEQLETKIPQKEAIETGARPKSYSSHHGQGESSVSGTVVKKASSDDDSCGLSGRIRYRGRNAVSEERCTERGDSSIEISSSQPNFLLGHSGFDASSEDSDLSLGEVVVVDRRPLETVGKKEKDRQEIKEKDKLGKSKDKARMKRRAKYGRSDNKPRANSVDITMTPRSKIDHGKRVQKPKDAGIKRVEKMLERSSNDQKGSNEKVPDSQQSSTVGLDWLFSTDTDSSDTTSHLDDHFGDSESVRTGSLSDSIFDETPENADIFNIHPEAFQALEATSPSSPSDGELTTMRKQGAIPKQFHKPLPPLPDPSSHKEDAIDTKASSPASFDLSDPEEFHRKLLEILNEPAETSEQLKKFMAVMEAKKYKTSSVKSKTDGGDKSPARKRDESSLGAEAMDTKSNDSKPVTPTEISILLPDSEMPQRGVTRDRKPVRKRHKTSRQRSNSPPPLQIKDAASHYAMSHDDTTEGATHLFQDEDGNWFSYTFGDEAVGTAVSMKEAADTHKNWKEDRWSSSSCASGSMVVLDSLKDEDKQMAALQIYNHHHDLGLPGSVDIRPPRGILQAYVDQLLESGRRFDSSSDTDSKEGGSSRNVPQTKHFYKFNMFPKKFLKIYFDRLKLLALLDRNLSVIENCVAVMMSVLVGVLGALVLAGGYYHDLCIFLFCFIMAGCQYSLLKSVQPDAASPMHGYNHLIVFSRPFYFCLCSSLLLVVDYVSGHVPATTVHVYGIPFTTATAFLFARDFFKVFLLCLPIVFTVGLLPQVNTFFMYMLEQIDTHVFGGNATVSLGSAAYCFIRSAVAAGFLYVICYLTLVELGKTIVDEPDPCKNHEFGQTAAFSIFCAVLVSLSYHLSRSASDPSVLWMLIKDKIFSEKEPADDQEKDGELKDPLPGKLKTCVSQRLQSDLLISVVIMILSFAIHVSTVFIQEDIDIYLNFIVAGFGFIIHYIIPQLRKEMPWLCCSHPLLKSWERAMFEALDAAEIMWYEKLYIWMRFIERNGMYPVVILCALTRSVPGVLCKFGSFVGPLVLAICSMKLLRFAFSNTPKQHMILAFTVLFFKYDMRHTSETFLVDYFFIAILLMKFFDLYLKMKFVVTYIAPWQITWGSAFHAFAQPFSVPHSAMLFLQAGVSALFSTPLNPFLGSAIFITSYVRPVKFWEKDYNTKRVDHSNTRLSQQLERNTGADDNNLNSIFYEHLTRSLQHSLCGDLLMGRWGNAEQGDTFIMASDSLNALVHIIEMGNGLVTFQLRGLEFRGTYCQQREVEAITEGVEDSEGFCCFEVGHLPHFLSLNAAFNQRWLSWEVVVTKYILEGYSISDNNAASMVGVFDFRKVLIMYYVQSIIYYTVRSPRLEGWLENPTILEALTTVSDDNYCDVDPTFSVHVDDDYDSHNSGISRKCFCNRHLDWIQYCASRREKAVDNRRDSTLVSLCFALSLLGRRALGTASHNNASASVEFFLYGLHALFKGDFRITSSRDEWVFADMELLRRVVSPGVRMSLKLHQDHFLTSDAYENEESLYNAISYYETNLVISHEADPSWRNAVLSNTPSLLALRNVFDEGSDEYKIIMLNKRYLSFRIVKVNRECVRGLWAGQQQELIFLRNRNPERGSIQNAKQALRNMINSSCDQPIGYPIYVSPLTTSYSSTNEQYTSVIGGEFIIDNVKRFFKNTWQSLRRHCGASCTSGSSGFGEADIPYSCTHQAASGVQVTGRGCPTSTPPTQPENVLNNMGNRGSLISTASSAASKPRSLVTLAGLIGENAAQKEVPHRVRITDIGCIYDNINLGRRIDVQWPNEEWRNNGGRNAWGGWYPAVGQEGIVIHRWVPCHRETLRRSHVDKTILLLHIGDRYVPVGELGVQDLGSAELKVTQMDEKSGATPRV